MQLISPTLSPYRLLKFFSLLFFPILYLISISLKIWQSYVAFGGRYFADPDYAYLINGLALRHLLAPLHIDHPGTPLQVFNLLLIEFARVTDIFGTQHLSSEFSVIEDPQGHLILVSIFFVIVQFLILVAIGFRLSHFMPFPLAISAQILPVIFAQSFLAEQFFRNRPEGFIFIFLLIAVYLLIPLVLSNSPSASISPELIFFGLSIGVAAATKISAWNVAFLLPLALRGLRRILTAYVALTIAMLILWIPIYTRAFMALGFWTSFSGTGRDSLLDIRGWFWEPLKGELWAVGLFLGVVLLFFTTVVLTQSRRLSTFGENTRSPWVNEARFLVFAVVIAMTSLVLANARNAPWFVPAIPVLSLGFAVALWGLWKLWTLHDPNPDQFPFTTRKAGRGTFDEPSKKGAQPG